MSELETVEPEVRSDIAEVLTSVSEELERKDDIIADIIEEADARVDAAHETVIQLNDAVILNELGARQAQLEERFTAWLDEQARLNLQISTTQETIAAMTLALTELSTRLPSHNLAETEPKPDQMPEPESHQKSDAGEKPEPEPQVVEPKKATRRWT